MSTLRRLLPSLAALLAVLVVVQTTDLVACADEAVAAGSSETHTDVLANGGHPVPACPGTVTTTANTSTRRARSPTACATSSSRRRPCVPEVGASARRPSPREFVYVADGLPEVEPLGLDHVPLS